MLKEEIDEAKRAVNTDTVQMTIGEVSNMYTSKELNILPDFQRLFRWSNERKSNFVESILIGIPVPPVFVYENENGTWELIDGLQRISTLLEFMGVLKDVDTGVVLRSQLQKTKYLPSLQGMVWEQKADGEVQIDKALQLFFRRARVDFQILKHPSDPKTKFDLFQRLNRGGAYANEQEVRTCSMVLANAEFTQAIRQFAQRNDVNGIFQITAEQRATQRDVEYIVRMIVHTFADYDRSLDVQEFLDAAIIDILTERDRDEVIQTLTWTLETLQRILGDRALMPPQNAGEGIASRFSLRALEAIAVGVARNKAAIMAHANPDQFVKDKIENFWQQPQVAEMSASGLRGTVRLQRTIPFGAQWFNPNA
ncbi:DUF262 domain-containing protein [Nitrobacter winogradskyi]|uniref:Uncharacterized protein n=2 Tax=Nitrobacter winogradskyi TaxID=913 RepID=A0ACC6AIT9_NITWI|nr:DUF262 domain-containing protein [Nitrobacter winogradskyi]MCP1999609.1 hypothetical protein [Nitrobacter winogradskyi]GEC17140.1 hypothetical protein NWI01_30320 [Nitrobacter winogradskyi]